MYILSLSYINLPLLIITLTIGQNYIHIYAKYGKSLA